MSFVQIWSRISFGTKRLTTHRRSTLSSHPTSWFSPKRCLYSTSWPSTTHLISSSLTLGSKWPTTRHASASCLIPGRFFWSPENASLKSCLIWRPSFSLISARSTNICWTCDNKSSTRVSITRSFRICRKDFVFSSWAVLRQTWERKFLRPMRYYRLVCAIDSRQDGGKVF